MLEVLGREFGSLKSKHSLKGIQLSNEEETATHYKFIDDTMLYEDASIKEDKSFKQIFIPTC